MLKLLEAPTSARAAWPLGLMDKAPAAGAGDSTLESRGGPACLCDGHMLFTRSSHKHMSHTHRGARTHDRKVKGLTLCRLS